MQVTWRPIAPTSPRKPLPSTPAFGATMTHSYGNPVRVREDRDLRRLLRETLPALAQVKEHTVLAGERTGRNYLARQYERVDAYVLQEIGEAGTQGWKPYFFYNPLKPLSAQMMPAKLEDAIGHLPRTLATGLQKPFEHPDFPERIREHIQTHRLPLLEELVDVLHEQTVMTLLHRDLIRPAVLEWTRARVVRQENNNRPMDELQIASFMSDVGKHLSTDKTYRRDVEATAQILQRMLGRKEPPIREAIHLLATTYVRFATLDREGKLPAAREGQNGMKLYTADHLFDEYRELMHELGANPAWEGYRVQLEKALDKKLRGAVTRSTHWNAFLNAGSMRENALNNVAAVLVTVAQKSLSPEMNANTLWQVLKDKFEIRQVVRLSTIHERKSYEERKAISKMNEVIVLAREMQNCEPVNGYPAPDSRRAMPYTLA